MKDKIHPKLHDAKIRCHCGFEIEAKSTKGKAVDVEICANCHPFYTGKQSASWTPPAVSTVSARSTPSSRIPRAANSRPRGHDQ